MSVRQVEIGCLLALAAVGCNGPVCGPGTFEYNGACETGEHWPHAPYCGPFTHADPWTHACVADYPPTVCDPETTVTIVDEDGVTVCYGRGTDPAFCSLGCPASDPGNVTLCGQLVHIEDDQGWSLGDGGLCDPTVPAPDGACALTLRFFDAPAFARDPATAQALEPAQLIVNACGRFAAKNIPVPSSGTVIVSVDDTGAPNDHVTSAVELPAQSGGRIPNIPLYVVRRSTDRLWTQTAGDPFSGQTFGDVGVYVPIFRYDRSLTAGVSVSGDSAASSFYFSNIDPLSRATVEPTQISTGPNGTALVVGRAFDVQASGGAIDTCSWPPLQTGTIPGVVLVDTVEAVDSNGDICQ